MKIFTLYSQFEKLILGFIISINIVSFLFYGIDKIKAKKKTWRIPETNLLILGLLGGGVGSLMAIVLFHHKISKKKFFIGVPIITLLNFIGFIYLFPILKGLI